MKLALALQRTVRTAMNNTTRLLRFGPIVIVSAGWFIKGLVIEKKIRNLTQMKFVACIKCRDTCDIIRKQTTQFEHLQLSDR